ncbi:hypothetical protein MLPF_1345 [Mycobacterium lepromatosis]|nr:hypothetical protein MLPF_1345 [Mycobacterium lepromatosis]
MPKRAHIGVASRRTISAVFSISTPPSGVGAGRIVWVSGWRWHRRHPTSGRCQLR